MWTVVAGALTPGASLNTSTGQISGTPTAAGVYSVTIRVSDSAVPQQSNQQTFDITNAAGMVRAVWIETSPGISKGVLVSFDPVTGQVSDISFSLNDPLRMITWGCSPFAFAPPEDSGIRGLVAAGAASELRWQLLGFRIHLLLVEGLFGAGSVAGQRLQQASAAGRHFH